MLVGDSSRGNSPECGVIQFERRTRKNGEGAVQNLQPFKVGGWKARDGKLLNVWPHSNVKVTSERHKSSNQEGSSDYCS